MYTIQGDNPTKMYFQTLSDLFDQGDRVAPRGKLIREMRPACLEFTNPYNRVTFLRGRRINPFFQIAESLWILSGRADVEWLEKFNKNIAQFSDDGKWFNAPYGERMRTWNKNALRGFILNPVDQLVDVYTKLITDPDTRQAVIVLSNPMFDNSSYTIGERGRDIACLTGDMVISSPEGDVSIQHLVEMFDSGLKSYPVYSYNLKRQIVEIKRAIAGKLTRKTTQVIQFTMGDGTKIKVTPDHKMYVKRYSTRMAIGATGVKYPVNTLDGYDLVEAQTLKIGDRLPYLLRGAEKQGYVCLNLHDLSKSASVGVKEHILYQEYLLGRPLKKEEVVHHINGNRIDNSARNLQVMSKRSHDALGMEGNSYPSGGKKNWTPKYLLTKDALFNQALTLVKSGGVLTMPAFQALFDGVGCLAAVKKHYGTFKAFKTQVYKNLGLSVPNGLSGSRGNYLATTIVDITILDELQDVYDITVEDNHNFFANGYLVHNCNLCITFKVRGNKLHMTVFNRSNDIHWGVFGANLCQFSTIQEVLYSWLKHSGRPLFENLEMGTYNHITDSLHVYLDDYGSKITDEVLAQYQTEFARDTLDIPFIFDDEPRMTLKAADFDEFLFIFWSHISPVLMSDETILNSQQREAIFGFGESSLLSDLLQREKIDQYWLFAIRAMLAYRLSKLDQIETALEIISHIPNCQWKVSMLYFFKSFIRKLKTVEDGVIRYQNTLNQYIRIVKDLGEALPFGLKGLMTLTDYLKLDDEGDNSYEEFKKPADVV